MLAHILSIIVFQQLIPIIYDINYIDNVDQLYLEMFPTIQPVKIEFPYGHIII